ncbi:gp093 [Rhodococcus phage ReqiDocB7]|uniref:gp093 n=1 Tax=Rhodococcus phage ReqiDocB7 TaxID=691966 RepID=UPI0001CDD876|nr:gp093 [Rhodococcus phage ReqiDocB7]ADD80879.1 gp093 [Rhodococcus phage ReqiDocB7]
MRAWKVTINDLSPDSMPLAELYRENFRQARLALSKKCRVSGDTARPTLETDSFVEYVILDRNGEPVATASIELLSEEDSADLWFVEKSERMDPDYADDPDFQVETIFGGSRKEAQFEILRALTRHTEQGCTFYPAFTHWDVYESEDSTTPAKYRYRLTQNP